MSTNVAIFAGEVATWCPDECTWTLHSRRGSLHQTQLVAVMEVRRAHPGPRFLVFRVHTRVAPLRVHFAKPRAMSGDLVPPVVVGFVRRIGIDTAGNMFGDIVQKTYYVIVIIQFTEPTIVLDTR